MTKYRSGYLRTPDGEGTVYFFQRFWEVQKPPYRRPLEYSYETNRMSGSETHPGYTTYYSIEQTTLGAGSRNKAYEAGNRAYAQLKEQLGSSSQWANNLLEVNQTISGATARLMQLHTFASRLRRADVLGAAKALGTPVPKAYRGKSKAKTLAKSFGDQFLEFHFGWMPMLEDIHAGMQALSSPDFGERQVKSSAQVNDRYIDRSESRSWPWHWVTIRNRFITYSAHYSCHVRVTNPNAYLANQLGLVNPASILYEAIPYSFVLDWFSNVGQILAAATDFVGLEVTQAYNTTSEEIKISGGDWSINEGDGRVFGGNLTGCKFSVHRGLGIPDPIPALKPFKGFSLTRGTTAISLLLQKMR